jgi:uncharacterized protein YjbI with pentapeptide repeats
VTGPISPMSSPRHLAILKKALTANDLSPWDDWRYQNSDIHPDLSGADLREANLSLADLRAAILTGANLDGASLRGSHLNGANLSRASLERTSLFHAKLSNAVLIGANLRLANLNRADLSEARLSTASLIGATLTGTNLDGANLTGANLDGANLTGANLVEANLSRANLANADFTKATVHLTTFADVDLSTVKGLDAVMHLGPSSVDVATIYKSAGAIPEVFLRGVGMPDFMIRHIQSLVGQRCDFTSCFISYSSQDDGFAQRLCSDLRASGLRAWSAPADLPDKFHASIDEARRRCEKLVVVLSEHSIDSEWVEQQVETAFEKEGQDDRTVLFPIRLDEAVMETTAAWAADIRGTRQICDFRNWESDEEYQKVFERLVRDLVRTG